MCPGLSPPAELWTRLHNLLKPSPAFYHFVLTHFRWFWDIINSTFIRDTLMRLVLTGAGGDSREGLGWVLGPSRTPAAPAWAGDGGATEHLLVAPVWGHLPASRPAGDISSGGPGG